MIKWFKQHILFLPVLLIAILVRIYRYNDLQFSYDELSALARIDYPTFLDFIKEGVMPDGHPALVQVFIYFYSKLFGTAAWVIKLPFMICGIGAVIFTYKIGEKYFSQITGLLSATFISLSQFYIYQSGTARPYIAGVFIVLVFFYYWLELVTKEKVSRKSFVLFSITACLSALDHHLCMMLVFFAVLFGFFLIHRTLRLKYFLFSLLSVILYSPHFPILFNQISIGGIGVNNGVGGWLPPPEGDFILNFLHFLFQYSWVLILTSICIFAFFISTKFIASRSKKLGYVLLTLFIVSFLVPFFYSIYVNPVLQFSGLIFSSPLLIIFIFSYTAEMSKAMKVTLTTILTMACMYGLAIDRKHFAYVYQQPFETYFNNHEDLVNEYGEEKVLGVFQTHKLFPALYVKNYVHANDVLIYDDEPVLNLKIFLELVSKFKGDILILGNLEPEYIYAVYDKFPFLLNELKGYNHEIVVLSKSKGKTVNQLSTLNYENDFSAQNTLFKFNPQLVDSLDKNVLKIDSLSEFPLSFSTQLDSSSIDVDDYLIAELELLADTFPTGLLCASIKQGEISEYWNAVGTENQISSNAKYGKLILSIFITTQMKKSKAPLQFFYWNNKKQSIRLKNFKIHSWKGNPARYGVINDF